MKISETILSIDRLAPKHRKNTSRTYVGACLTFIIPILALTYLALVIDESRTSTSFEISSFISDTPDSQVILYIYCSAINSNGCNISYGSPGISGNQCFNSLSSLNINTISVRRPVITYNYTTYQRVESDTEFLEEEVNLILPQSSIKFVPTDSLIAFPLCYSNVEKKGFSPSIYIIQNIAAPFSRLLFAGSISSNLQNEEANINLSDFTEVNSFSNGDTTKITFSLTRNDDEVALIREEYWSYSFVSNPIIDISQPCWDIILGGDTCSGYELTLSISSNYMFSYLDSTYMGMARDIGGVTALIVLISKAIIEFYVPLSKCKRWKIVRGIKSVKDVENNSPKTSRDSSSISTMELTLCQNDSIFDEIERNPHADIPLTDIPLTDIPLTDIPQDDVKLDSLENPSYNPGGIPVMVKMERYRRNTVGSLCV